MFSENVKQCRILCNVNEIQLCADGDCFYEIELGEWKFRRYTALQLPSGVDGWCCWCLTLCGGGMQSFCNVIPVAPANAWNDNWMILIIVEISSCECKKRISLIAFDTLVSNRNKALAVSEEERRVSPLFHPIPPTPPPPHPASNCTCGMRGRATLLYVYSSAFSHSRLLFMRILPRSETRSCHFARIEHWANIICIFILVLVATKRSWYRGFFHILHLLIIK